jgi:biopolymer transport protein ExbD
MRSASIRLARTTAVGLVALIVLTATSCRQNRAAQGQAQKELSIKPAPQPANPLRLAVADDGGITVDGQAFTGDLQALTSRLTGPNSGRPVQLRVDPRASGKTVDDVLDRLSSAGVSLLSLVVEPPASGATFAGTPQTDKTPSDAASDADFEVPVIEVRSRAKGVSYRIGKREADSAEELLLLLEPLARLGRTISVRISHDGPFAHSAAAIAACRDAGFTTILLLAGATGS